MENISNIRRKKFVDREKVKSGSDGSDESFFILSVKNKTVLCGGCERSFCSFGNFSRITKIERSQPEIESFFSFIRMQGFAKLIRKKLQRLLC